MDEILGEFIAETLETLETLSGEVVAWEADPTDQSRLDAFFRFFHTVKGSCGFLNLPRFERLAHEAEDVLAGIRRGDRTADPVTITAVLAVMDRIGALARNIGEADPIPEADDDALLDALSVQSGGFEIFVPLPNKTFSAVKAAKDATQKQVNLPAVVPGRPLIDHQEIEPFLDLSAMQASEAPEGAVTPPRDRAPRTIRLPLALIDQLMNGISDMVLARNDLARKMRDHGVAPDLESSFERLSTNIADLRDMISKTRMQRVDRLYVAIPRMMRDLTRELGKQAVLDLDGGDVEMDREMIEMVVDPLTHIVRNALDHGIELPAMRRAAGKAEAGRLRIIARQSGNQIVIEVSDDGRGIDRVALAEKAIAAGIVTAAEVAAMSDADKLHLIFHPGLSTAPQVTSISGRGVGMDVVRANIEQIGGVIDITSQPGKGTTIVMRVPLTLTIIPGLIVRCGSLLFAMPRGNVVELLHENSNMVAMEQVGGALIATIRGERHAVIYLEDVLQLERREAVHGPRTLMVIRSSHGQPYVLGVEEVESHEELVIRPASPAIAAAGVFAGMTLPDNGQPMLLLDAAGLAQVAELPLRDLTSGANATAAPSPVEPTIQALLYCDRDGTQRLLPLSVVDRVEDIDAAHIMTTNGCTFARIEGQLLPALNGPIGAAGSVKSLRLHDGREQLCFLIDDVVDIVLVPAKLDISLAAGRIAGLVMYGDVQLEMIDPLTLFAEAALWQTSDPRSPRAIHCRIADIDDPWMRNILAPLLLQAGHEVSFGMAGDASPDVILCSEDHPMAVGEGVPVVALRNGADAPADPTTSLSVYRYDRESLMAAISDAARRAA